ncbi:apolipoprotein N-acyltransferase [Kitasatospora sp. NPDC052896]|uniref:apolipoprotein N-acyltransferase n=1 Tax=Kitasatospora sp. NPDC052896 TaxID=3364061 RepID=UPI0037C83F15
MRERVAVVAGGAPAGSVRRDLAGPLRGLLAGQCLGQCGDGLAQIAFAQFVLFDVGRGATPARIAAVLAVTLLPFSVVGPFGGVLIDRFDRRRLLVVVSLLRLALVLASVAIVAVRATVAAYLAVLLLLSASRLVLTAKGAALPRTVPPERLVPANALSAVAGTAAAFVGAVGGSQLVGHSEAAGLLLAGVFYALAAVVFGALPALGGRRAEQVLPRLRRTAADLADGIRAAARTPVIRRALLSVTAHRFLLGAGFVVLVLVADSEYRLRTPGYGIALAATGVAAFTGSLAAPPLAARYGARALLPAAFPVAGAGAYVGGLYPSLWVLVPCVGVAAFAFQVLKVSADALVGGTAPDALRGRVFACYDVLYNVAFVLAGLAMVPFWHPGHERALLWWVAAGFALGWAVLLTADRSRRPRRARRDPAGRVRWARRGAAVLFGALPALALPAPAWWWLAWFALVPLTLLVRAAPTRREGVVRAWWGLGGFEVAAQYWLLPDIGPALPLLGALLAALWLPWGWTVHRLLNGPLTVRRAAAALLAVPSAWTCAEAARSWQSLGGPWALLGATQWDRPALLASASLGGVWLTGFLITAVNTALAIAVLSARARPHPAAAVTALVAAAGCLAVGPAWAALGPAPRPDGTVPIAVVQPGVVAPPAVRQADEQAATARLAALPPGERPVLVVWGESSLGADLTGSPAGLAPLRALSRRVGADLLVNGDAPRLGTPGRYKESALVSPAGIVGGYDKIRLVPFGEYIPLRSALGWLTGFSKAAPVNVLRGDHTVVLHTSGLAFGPLICFESAFPDLARTEVANGAQLLVYQSSDSTFQGSWAQPQHASLAAVRAVETGRPAVQVALTGDSAAFAADGRQLAWSPAGFSGAYVVRVPLTTGTTGYRQAGDWMLALAFTVLGGTASWATVRPASERGTTTAGPGGPVGPA